MPRNRPQLKLNMGGVDLSNMRCYIFLDKSGTIRWNKKVFFTLLSWVLLNSFILYQYNTCINVTTVYDKVSRGVSR